VNVLAGLMHKLIGPLFFSEKTVAGRSYLDMLELYALPQLPPQTILQQDGALPHFCHHVRNHLDRDGWEISAEVDQSLGLVGRLI
jgi:hypothetical protein